jgi:hypothetical protein
MKLGRIAGIAATIIACSVWIGTFAEAKARHRAASAKTSTVTSFESAAGTRCHGTCFNSGRSHTWTCPASNASATAVCHLACNARPPEPVEDCLFR